MKTTVQISIYLFLTLFIYSCSTDYQTEPQTATESPVSSINKTKNTARLLTAGDGLFDVLGCGYNVVGEFANSNSAGFRVIDVAKFKAENPERFMEEFPNSTEYSEEYGENAEAYSKMVSNKLSITAGFKLFGKTLSASYSSSLTSTNKFDGKYIYSSYNLTIKQKRMRFNTTNNVLMNYLTPEFVADLNTYTPAQLVNTYGTHVLLDIYTGAKMDVVFQSETTNTDRVSASRIGIKAGIKDVFSIDNQVDIDITSSSKNFSRKLSYKTRGGDPSKALVGQLSLDQTVPKINITDWQNSSTKNNSVLVDFGVNNVNNQSGMVYLYDLVSDPVKKANLKVYIDQYLLNNQVNMEYISVPIYRYYTTTSDHYYTISTITPPYYVPEGIEFYAFSYKTPNTVPIYMYYSPSLKDHFYTTSSVTPSNYVSEGIGFYAYQNQVSNTVPIYRYYRSFRTYGDHFYSRSSVTPVNYVSEGIEFYAFATQQTK